MDNLAVVFVLLASTVLCVVTAGNHNYNYNFNSNTNVNTNTNVNINRGRYVSLGQDLPFAFCKFIMYLIYS